MFLKVEKKNAFVFYSSAILLVIMLVAIYRMGSENEQLQEDNEVLKGEVIRLDGIVDELEDTIEKKDKAIFSHEANRDKLEAKIKELEKTVDNLKESVNSKDVAIKELKQKAQSSAKTNKKKTEVTANATATSSTTKQPSKTKATTSDTRKEDTGYTNTEVQQSNEADSGTAVGTFHATYYGADCVGCSGITAGGVNVTGTQFYNGMRVVAADPSVLPLGTVIRVKGSSIGDFIGIVMDTGGAIKGNRLDILVGSEAESSAYGRSTVQVEVL